jgi:Zn-dependent protease with chaperone function
MGAIMTTQVIRLPSRKWSIVALGTGGMAMVVVSYLIAIALAFACLALPVLLLWYFPLGGQINFVFMRLLLSAFGVVAGLTILWSLVPPKDQHEVNGVRIDLAKEKRLAKEIEAIAGALREPMPSEVYLIGDANAFVSEVDEVKGFGRRRILALGLPLLQILTIKQFRAVLAHEFAHYYAGDTRLGPWVYDARKSLIRVYENLGKNSDILRFLRRWGIVSIIYQLLMSGLRAYWQVFMRITQAISRRQEIRSDELACYVAGSQPLIEGLESIQRCSAVLSPYWNSVVLPVAVNGFQPQLGDGFLRFMHAPQIEKATAEYLAKQESAAKTSPMDTHPPLKTRIHLAQTYNLPTPDSDRQAEETDLPMISLIDDLGALEGSLLKRYLPALAKTDLKPLEWEKAGIEVYVPIWRKKAESVRSLLSTKTVADIPSLVKDPKALPDMVPNPPGKQLNWAQRDAAAMNLLFCAFAVCLLDHDWKVHSQPGTLYLEHGENKVEPGEVISAIKAGKLPTQEWGTYCAQRAIGDWPLASSKVEPAQVAKLSEDAL